MAAYSVQVFNAGGKFRVVSTKPMPGNQWIQALVNAGCRVEVCTSQKTILSVEDILSLIGSRCDGVIGQLTEEWGETLFSALKKAGGHAFSNMAVGYNNVDVEAANKHGIAVGNTPVTKCLSHVPSWAESFRPAGSSISPLNAVLHKSALKEAESETSQRIEMTVDSCNLRGVLTETTAELAAALTLSAARRVVEADDFMRAGKYDGWLPNLFVGNLLKGQTVGIIGAGRIGSAYARMMVEGFKMNVIYYDLYQSKFLENFVTAYGNFLKSQGETPVTWKRASSAEEVLREADVVSLHPVLDKTTYHLINKERLSMMKKEAVLVNASRGPVIDEVALVEHLKVNPMFRVGLDVFEAWESQCLRADSPTLVMITQDEPYMKPGLGELPNAVVVPHIASASKWTREGMATLAALNVAGKLQGFPVWHNSNMVLPFLDENSPAPKACPSIVNAKVLGLQVAAPVSKM
ncbi:hypothetical protein AXG93_3384s1960 [Marchantia polymorpha subsp. ruderalis]|uniref:glycerate dehydrogenase n=1 Tax=Marchantia polymorpha subsp. ruderalis TaxID=1480154 RepID=A0A176WGK2_MARPO|nr:hypothetical protein AXG93_3384s1960 [Marchantia polymorpha subsp. ruderalis]